jgi:oligosaccharide repeat unit polymerase
MPYPEQGPYPLRSRFVGGIALPSVASSSSLSSQEAGTEFVPMNLRHRLLALAVLGCLVLAVITAFLVMPQDKSPWLLPAFLLYATLLSVPFVFYQRSFGWLHPVVFTALYAIYNLIKKSHLYLLGLTAHRGLPGLDAARLNELIAYELILMSLGLFSYYLGFSLLRINSFQSFRLPRLQNAPLKSTLAVLFSASLFAVYMYTKGGFAAHIQDFSHRSVTMDGEGFWQALTSIGAVACLLWLVAEAKTLTSPVFWCCSALSLGINYFTTGSRATVVYFLVVGGMVLMLKHRKIFLAQFSVLILVSLVLVGVLGNFRRSTWSGAADWSTLLNFNLLHVVTGDAASEIVERGGELSPALAILERVPRDIPLLYGSSYFSLLAFPIPKALWPDKPQGIHSLTGETFFNLIAGTPPGMVGEAYWNFHLPGVVLAFFLFGFFHRCLSNAYRSNAGHPVAVLVYTITLFLVQGESGSIPFWLSSTLPMVVLIALFAIPLQPFQKRRAYARSAL